MSSFCRHHIVSVGAFKSASRLTSGLVELRLAMRNARPRPTLTFHDDWQAERLILGRTHALGTENGCGTIQRVLDGS
jgi:hypothetical protein